MSKPWYKRIFSLGSKKVEDQASDLEDSEFLPAPYIESNNSSYELKRKRTPFRFPLIPDDEPLVIEKSPISKPTTPIKKTKDIHPPQLEKGWLKKAQEIPSPIYGFHRPEKKDAYIEDNSRDQLVYPVPELQLEYPKYEVYQESKEEEILNELPSDQQDQIHSGGVKELSFDEQVSESPVEAENSNENTDQSEWNKSSQQKEQLNSKAQHEGNTDSPVLQNANITVNKPKIPYNVFYFGNLEKTEAKDGNSYQFPKLHFLTASPKKTHEDTEEQREMVENLQNTLNSFNVQAKVTGIMRGPTVTRIEVQPAPGVKVNRITNLIDDIKLNLAAKDIRIEAPIPGKSAVGIEVPNREREPVNIYDIVSSQQFRNSTSPLTVALGKDIEGKPVIMDLRRMPHGLIAGSTGSGKSVCINSIIISLLYKATPDEVKMILIDPKMVELAPYHDLPHLATPVVTDPKQATLVLKWACEEMDRRYELFAQNGVRDIGRYNELMAKRPEIIQPAMPYILIIIDELADLMMVAPGDVEDSIARIAQKARACGIHLLVATQRPSVDVITGMIKANIPTRIAFSVSSQVDSRTILDCVGAERLLGRGDMLLLENGSNKPVRLQGNYVSDQEIETVCHFVRGQRKPKYLFDRNSLTVSTQDEIEDDLFREAVQFVIEQEQASTSLLQRKFRIGYNRAARLIDLMEQKGFISQASGSGKPRNVLITMEEFLDQ